MKKFEIKNLLCSYPSKKVMYIEELNIKSGEIVFILGNSGSGKSTLIETLGLMANNIDKEKSKEGQIVYFQGYGTDPKDYHKIWNDGLSVGELAEIRRQNFNFIFQDNNLMPSFLNYENVVLADLRGKLGNIITSIRKTRESFKRLFLPRHTWKTIPRYCSGGEQQRVAFARGIVPDFEVLFGDEPTGNLDKSNSKVLFDHMVEKIKEKPERSAVIVTHDIELALKYATKIVVLKRALKKDENGNIIYSKTSDEPAKPFGDENYEVLRNNIYLTDGLDSKGNKIWKYNSGNIVPDLQKEILDILDNNITGCVEINHERPQRKIRWLNKVFACFSVWIFNLILKNKGGFKEINQTFMRLFLVREFAVLNGKFKFFGILLAFLASFIILAWTTGKLNSLEYEMNNPFVLTLDVILTDVSMIDPTQNYLNKVMRDNDTVAHYNLDTISYYNRDFLGFFDDEDGSSFGLMGRTIDPNDQLLDKIMETERINPVGRPFEDKYDFGIIVTRDLLKLIGYKGGDHDIPPFVTIEKWKSRDDGDWTEGDLFHIPVPLIAVVDKLPGNTGNTNYFLITTNFYDNYKDSKSEFVYTNGLVRLMAYFNKSELQMLKNALKQTGEDLQHQLPTGNFIEIESRLLTTPALSYFLNQGASNNGGSFGCSRSRSANLVEEGNGNGKTTDQFSSEIPAIYEIILYPEKTSIPDSLQLQYITEAYNQIINSAALKKFNSKLGKNLKNRKTTLPPEAYLSLSHFSKLNTTQTQMRDAISFLFSNGKKISEFANKFKEATKQFDPNYEGLSMDLTKVITANSFQIIGRISEASLFVIILLIMTVLFYYIYNIINFHLYKIQKNIGTLMAFGVNIRPGYFLLIITFILVAFLIPFAIVAITSKFIDFYYPTINFSLFRDMRGIGLTVLTFFIVICGLVIVLIKNNKKYFKVSPSDLIYGKKDN
jgi:lipoprotein-releasing system ATP-binding protein